MTNKRIEIIYSALVNIGKAELPAKIAFSVARNINILEPIYNDYVNASRSILYKYGEQDKVDGDNLVFKFPTEEAKNKATQELEDLEQFNNPNVKLYKIKEQELIDSLGNIPFSVANGLQYILEED